MPHSLLHEREGRREERKVFLPACSCRSLLLPQNQPKEGASCAAASASFHLTNCGRASNSTIIQYEAVCSYFLGGGVLLICHLFQSLCCTLYQQPVRFDETFWCMKLRKSHNIRWFLRAPLITTRYQQKYFFHSGKLCCPLRRFEHFKARSHAILSLASLAFNFRGLYLNHMLVN